jgi:hypothetical protein
MRSRATSTASHEAFARVGSMPAEHGCLLINAAGAPVARDADVARVIDDYRAELHDAIARGIAAAVPAASVERHARLADAVTGLVVAAFALVRRRREATRLETAAALVDAESVRGFDSLRSTRRRQSARRFALVSHSPVHPGVLVFPHRVTGDDGAPMTLRGRRRAMSDFGSTTPIHLERGDGKGLAAGTLGCGGRPSSAWPRRPPSTPSSRRSASSSSPWGRRRRSPSSSRSSRCCSRRSPIAS